MITFIEFLEIKNNSEFLSETEWYERLKKEQERYESLKNKRLESEDKNFASNFLEKEKIYDSIPPYRVKVLIDEIVKYIQALRNKNKSGKDFEISDLANYLSSEVMGIGTLNFLKLEKDIKYHLQTSK